MEFSATHDRCESLNRLLSGIATGFGGSEIDHKVIVPNSARDHTIGRCIDEMVNSFRRAAMEDVVVLRSRMAIRREVFLRIGDILRAGYFHYRAMLAERTKRIPGSQV